MFDEIASRFHQTSPASYCVVRASATGFYIKDLETGSLRRHQTHEPALQKAIPAAAHAAKIGKSVSPLTYTHVFNRGPKAVRGPLD